MHYRTKIEGVFVSSITGNLVVACASISYSHGLTCRCLVTLAFAVTAFCSSFLALKLIGAYKYRKKPLAIILFSIEVALLTSAWIAGIKFEELFKDSVVDLNSWKVILVGVLMGAAMGSHNSAAKECIPNCPATTVMTTTLVNLSSGLSNVVAQSLATIPCLRLMPPNGPNGSYLPLTTTERETHQKLLTESYTKFVVLAKPFISFLIGSVVGALAMLHISFHCLVIPIIVLLSVIVDMQLLIMKENCLEGCPLEIISINGTTPTSYNNNLPIAIRNHSINISDTASPSLLRTV